MASIEVRDWRLAKDPATGRRVRVALPRGQKKYVAHWRDPQGRQKSKTFDLRKDAEASLQRIGVEIQDHEYVDPKLRRVLFDHWAAIWWRSTIRHADSTRRGYHVLLHAHVLPYFSGRRVGAIDYMDVEEFISDRLKAGLNPKRVADMLSVTALILDGPMYSNVRRDNPARGHKVPRHRKKIKQGDVPALAEMLSLIEQIPARYKPAVWLLVLTGIRPCELAGLRVRNVDFQRHRISIEASLVPVVGFDDVKSHLQDGPPKTEAGYRTIPIPEWLTMMLSEMLAARAEDRGGPVHRDEHLVVGQRGKPLNTNWFRQKIVVPALFAAGLPIETRTYDLRHSHASILIEQGANILAIAQRMGHTDPTVTLRVYGHLFDDLQEGLTERLADEVRVLEERPPAVVSLGDRRVEPRPRLSPAARRESVRALRAQGKSGTAIALILGVSGQTVFRDLRMLGDTPETHQNTPKSGSKRGTAGQARSIKKGA